MLILTLTSGRPKAFAALTKWVQAQSIENYSWLIVSDDYEGYKFPKGKNITVIKRDDPQSTLNHNLLEAIEWMDSPLQTEHDDFVIMEDDDFYAPEYLRETKELLKKADLVGYEHDAFYYVLNRKARRVHNVGWSPLATTAFNRSVLPYLKECCAGDVFIEMRLWKGIQQIIKMPQPPMTLPDGRILTAPPTNVCQTVKEWSGTRLLVDNFTGLYGDEQPKMDKGGNILNEHPRHVGIKQNWHGGTKGLSSKGHDPMQGGGPDIWGDKLRQWIGEDAAKFYLSFTHDPEGKKTGRYPANIMLPLPVESFN